MLENLQIDFGSGGLARFDGSSDLEQNMMGNCFKVEFVTAMKVLIGGPHSPFLQCNPHFSANLIVPASLALIDDLSKYFRPH